MLGLQGNPGGPFGGNPQAQDNKALGSLGNQRWWAQVEAVLKAAIVWGPWPSGLETSARPWGHLWVTWHGMVLMDMWPALLCRT